MVLACFQSLSVGGHARSRAERLLGIMPVFSCGSEKRKALATVIFEGQGKKKSGVANFIPFFRMPLMGAAAEGAEDMIGPRVGRAKRADRPKRGGLCWDVKEESKRKERFQTG